jgi:hypothetical protein
VPETLQSIEEHVCLMGERLHGAHAAGGQDAEWR